MQHPEMQKMLNAQDLEKSLVALKADADVLSVPLEKARARRAAVKQDVRAVKAKLEDLQKRRREAEATLADSDTRARTARERQQTATSTREVSDLERAIELAVTQSAASEESVLEMLEQEDELQARVTELEAKAARDLETIEAEMKRLGDMLKEKQELAKDLREERIAALNRMEEETRENYEWLVRKHGPGQAVADARDGSCGGCGAMLLPDQLQKVRDESQLFRCTHCYRFLQG